MIKCFQLTAPIDFDSYQKPIKLASRSSYVGRPATIAGWGYLVANAAAPPDYLQKLYTTVQDISYCQSQMTTSTLYSDHVCTIQPSGQGACRVSWSFKSNFEELTINRLQFNNIRKEALRISISSPSSLNL